MLITGAGGSVGSEISRKIVELRPRTLILLENSEYALYKIEQELSYMNLKEQKLEVVPVLGSICDNELLNFIRQKYEIDIIYHTASFKHVPLLEVNPIAAFQNNVLGTKNIASLAKLSKAEQAILISTDKAVNAVSVMGKTKRIAEHLFQSAAQEVAGDTEFKIIRFGNLIGSSGSVIPLFKEQIRQGKNLTITEPEMTRYFICISEAVNLTLLSTKMSIDNKVIIFDMGEPVRILDIAKKLIEESGYSVRDTKKPEGEIGIEFIGMRRGEKLHEELSFNSELKNSEYPKIKLADEPVMSRKEVNALLEKIEKACQCRDIKTLNKLI
ncbi:polysaccharide biosynthesis protein [Aliikangiella sp. G2MR2-5]|uniref:polysaccharide biosynthesis protein n=1 Tax=Aliikangiella sp. G2MR2-5 TaxID=2788943 RepID=UPI0018AA343C